MPLCESHRGINTPWHFLTFSRNEGNAIFDIVEWKAVRSSDDFVDWSMCRSPHHHYCRKEGWWWIQRQQSQQQYGNMR